MRPRPLLSLSSHIVPRVCALLAAASMLSCSGGSASPKVSDDPALTLCGDPRPQMCTRDYRPVCGVSRDGSRKTYGNACGACSHQDVVGHYSGEC